MDDHHHQQQHIHDDDDDDFESESEYGYEWFCHELFRSRTFDICISPIAIVHDLSQFIDMLYGDHHRGGMEITLEYGRIVVYVGATVLPRHDVDDTYSIINVLYYVWYIHYDTHLHIIPVLVLLEFHQ